MAIVFSQSLFVSWPTYAWLENTGLVFIGIGSSWLIETIGNKDKNLSREISVRRQAEEEIFMLYKDLKTLNEELEQKVRERTAELEAAKLEAEKASRAKSSFLAAVSHELRTPLNAVIGFADLLLDDHYGLLNTKQNEYANDIAESGRHLLSLINDLLDISKVEAGRMELEYSLVDIETLLHDSLILVKQKALKNDIKLAVETSAEIEGMLVRADERRLKQIMFNLLSNAAKFTPDKGSITVEGYKRDGELVISVSDTGIGIAEDNLDKVFEQFYQVCNSLRDKTPGTGLGLSLVKNMVEMHGGRIWAESRGTGKGSRFSFTLPVSA